MTLQQARELIEDGRTLTPSDLPDDVNEYLPLEADQSYNTPWQSQVGPFENNYTYYCRKTLLHIAIEKENILAIQVLLNNGADLSLPVIISNKNSAKITTTGHTFEKEAVVKETHTYVLARPLIEKLKQMISTLESSHVFFEPITFTVVALWAIEKLAGGFLEEMGADYYRKVTGQQDRMESAIRKMATDIKDYIGRVLAEQYINQLTQLADTVKRLHKDFIRAPSRDRLAMLTEKVEDLLTGARNDTAPNEVALETHELYIGAVALKLMILRQREKLYPENRDGEKRNAVALMVDAKQHLDVMMDTFLNIANSNLQRDRDFEKALSCMDHAGQIITQSDSSLYGKFKKYEATLKRELSHSITSQDSVFTETALELAGESSSSGTAQQPQAQFVNVPSATASNNPYAFQSIPSTQGESSGSGVESRRSPSPRNGGSDE